MITAAAAALALAGCGPQVDPAQQKIFDTCMEGVAREFPDTAKPGVKIVSREQAEVIGNYKENCMNEFGYTYAEGKTGCRRPPTWDPDYPEMQSDVTCYAPTNPR